MADEEYTGEEQYEEQQTADDGMDGENGGAEDQGENGGGAESGETSDNANNPSSSTEATAEVPLGSKIGVRGADDDKKIFVGGLHWETTAPDLKEYFSKFGTVVDCTLKMDHTTGKSRGFGFVLFDDIATVEKVIGDKTHTIRSKAIDVKRAQSKPGREPVKKVFVGGISPDLSEDDIREYFSQYGKIEEVELPFDKSKNQRRAFVFVTFETEEMADKAVAQAKQKIGDKEVDLRKATPKTDQDSYGGRGGRGGGSMRGGQQRGAYAGYTAYPGYGGYDYSAYYGAGYGYSYPGYGAPGYDYSGYGYYGQAGGDWSGYAAYGGGYQDQQAAGGSGGFKAKRGGSSSGASGYHPYSR